MRSFFSFLICALIQITFKNLNHLLAIGLSPTAVIFEHLGESVFIHALKKVKSGRIASGQTFGNALRADSSDGASKPNYHSAKNHSVACPCSFGKTMLLLGKHAN